MTVRPGSNTPALALREVVKQFGTTTAVNRLSLTMDQGTVLALLGPNGAGKTTTIEMCEGFQQPTSGELRVLGLDPSTDPIAVRRRIGIMLQGGGAYPGIRVEEMLRLVASYTAKPLDVPWLLELVGLEKHRKTSYRRLSGGQQQRLSLACALVGRPELIFLDEPTAGMDAQSRLAVWDLVAALKRDGVSVVLTTHLMDEAEALADNVIIIDHGQIVAQGSPQELTSQLSQPAITIETAAALDLTQFEAAVGLPVVANRPLSYQINTEPAPELLTKVIQAAQAQDVLVVELSANRKSLEDVFLEITGRGVRR